MSNTIACSLGSSTANISACTDAGAALVPLQTGQSPNDPPQVGAKSTATSNHPITPYTSML